MKATTTLANLLENYLIQYNNLYMSEKNMITSTIEFKQYTKWSSLLVEMVITVTEKWPSLSLKHLKIKENNNYSQIRHDYKLYNKV